MIDLFILSSFLLINVILFLCKISINFTICSIVSFVLCVCIVLVILKYQKKRITFSTVVLMYTMVTQFGLIIPYAFFGDEVLQNYSAFTLRFLESPNLIYAIYTANIAILSFAISIILVSINNKNHMINNLSEDIKAQSKLRYTATILLSLVLLFFIFHFLSGGTSIVSTYEKFRSSSAYNSSIYSYILIFFYVGTLYLAAAGKIKQNKIGWCIWIIIVIIFAFNGNKGEFMYALLSVIGLYGVRGNIINMKTMALISLVLFIVIPFITSFRDIGIVSNFNNIDMKFTDSFVEMGMQIRTNVFVLDDINNGMQQFLIGKSYYMPIINIVLFFIPGKSVATYDIKNRLAGMGFSQVTESYLNFGILGIIIFFFVIGFVLTKLENKVNSIYKLAYLGSFTCILINATRNYFAFVPGQIIAITAIYMIMTKMKITI